MVRKENLTKFGGFYAFSSSRDVGRAKAREGGELLSPVLVGLSGGGKQSINHKS